MPVTAVIGGHWGDEGKGKVVDALAASADLVIRYNGGSNAGHTVVTDRSLLRLHLVPSGIAHPHVDCLIGPGVVVNPPALLEEVRGLEGAGLSMARLRISDRAHLVLPVHLDLDALVERARGQHAHGTTRQGIWPAYADKAARIGVRAGDLHEPEFLKEQLTILARRAAALQVHYGGTAACVEDLYALCQQWRDWMGRYIIDSHPMVQTALREDRTIVLEGQLGVMRDLDWGLYPFVTSSTTLAGGAAAGAGIPPQRISSVIGVVKAYTTAVGSGPMPTELHDAVGEQLRARGQEYGTSTGRPRRCGWFDGVAARFAAQVAGFTDLAVMKLDILDGFESVKICVAYRDGTRLLDSVPHTAVMSRVEPVYDVLPGWPQSDGARSLGDLPEAAQRFLDRLEQVVGVRVAMVGVGRDREALILGHSAVARDGGRA